MAVITEAMASFFWARVERRSDDECWPWKPSQATGKRGTFNRDGLKTAAPRVALMVAGVDVTGLNANHKCHNPNCVNPKHLYAGTQSQNMRDSSAIKRFPNQNKTHCPKGHPYDGESLYVWGTYRYCRPCHLEHARAYAERNRDRERQRKAEYKRRMREQRRAS